MLLADLLAHGLIRASFVPPVAVQESRTLTRTRKQFVLERTSHMERIERVLEDANLKISCVQSVHHCSRVLSHLGKSGRTVLHALINGQSDPQRLASYVVGRFMLKLHLGHIAALDKAMPTSKRR